MCIYKDQYILQPFLIVSSKLIRRHSEVYAIGQFLFNFELKIDHQTKKNVKFEFIFRSKRSGVDVYMNT